MPVSRPSRFIRSIMLLLVFIMALVSLSVFQISGSLWTLNKGGIDGGKTAQSCEIPKHKMLFMTYANKPIGFFCKMVASAVCNGLSINVLGWDERGDFHPHEWHLGQKVLATLAFLDRNKSSVTDMVQKFIDRGADYVMGTEFHCWPEIFEHSYPKTPRDGFKKPLYTFVNSGGWIARAGAARVVLHQALEDRPDWRTHIVERDDINKVIVRPGVTHDEPVYLKRNDQIIYADLYVKGKSNIVLDHNATLFQSMAFDDAAFGEKKWLYIDPDTHVVVNRLADTIPVALHYNGNAKSFEHDMRLDAVYEKLWFSIDPKRDKVLPIPCTLPENAQRYRPLLSGAMPHDHSLCVPSVCSLSKLDLKSRVRFWKVDGSLQRVPNRGFCCPPPSPTPTTPTTLTTPKKSKSKTK